MTWQPGRLRHLTDMTAADWIRPRLAPFGSGLTAIVPSGFDAYARILHPVLTNDDAVTTWSAVAAETGKVAHAQMQWHVIATLPSGRQLADQGGPDEGVLEEPQLQTLCAVLRRHSRDREDCVHALWNGHGGWSSGGRVMRLDRDGREGPWRAARCVLPSEVVGGPLLLLPNREYFMFAGPVDAALDFVHSSRVGDFQELVSLRQEPVDKVVLIERRSPQLIWPADHSWCVATEIDLDSTLVGGSTGLIDDIVTSPDLEAFPIASVGSLGYDADRVNDPDGSITRAWYAREFGGGR